MPYFFNERMTQEGVGKIDGHQTPNDRLCKNHPKIARLRNHKHYKKHLPSQLDKTRHKRRYLLPKPLQTISQNQQKR